MVLVGTVTNEYIVDILRVSINPFDFSFIPEKYIPSLSFSSGAFSP